MISSMTLNLDKLAGDDEYVHYGEPTTEELAEIENAKYIVRSIGDSLIRGYSNTRLRAYGLALRIAMNSMVAEGAQIDVKGIDDSRIELRISEDRESTLVRWVYFDSETVASAVGKATAT
jgi:hypothetical protein